MANYHVWASLRRMLVDFLVLGLLHVCGYLCPCILQMRADWNWSYAFSSAAPSVLWDFRTPNPATSHLSAPLPAFPEPAGCEDQHALSIPVLLTVSHDWYRLWTLAVALLRRSKHGVCDTPKNSLRAMGVVSLGTWHLWYEICTWSKAWSGSESHSGGPDRDNVISAWKITAEQIPPILSKRPLWMRTVNVVSGTLSRGAHLKSLNTSCFSSNQSSFGESLIMCVRKGGEERGRQEETSPGKHFQFQFLVVCLGSPRAVRRQFSTGCGWSRVVQNPDLCCLAYHSLYRKPEITAVSYQLHYPAAYSILAKTKCEFPSSPLGLSAISPSRAFCNWPGERLPAQFPWQCWVLALWCRVFLIPAILHSLKLSFTQMPPGVD